LRGLKCPGRHGEARSDQTYVVDVAIEMDLAAVAESDAYADVVDLADLAHTVRQSVAAPPRLLLETVAVHTARLVLERYSLAHSVALRIASPNPHGLDAAEEAVSLRLDRPTA